MPRKGCVAKRDVIPDPIYKSKLVTKLINNIMIDGKKGLAQSILYKSFKIIEEKSKKPAVDVFNEALNNIMPVISLKVRRFGAVNYQVPTEISQEKRTSLALRWLVNYSRLRNEKTMEDKLAAEILDAVKGLGASVKKKEEVHKMAEANKAYANYHW